MSLIDDYTAGIKIAEISTKYNITPRSITRRVRKAGCKPRSSKGWIVGGPGRPSQELTEYVMVRMDKDMKTILADKAKKKGTTMSKLARDYFEWGMENDE